MRQVREVQVDEEAPEYGRRRSIDRRDSASGKNFMLGCYPRQAAGPGPDDRAKPLPHPNVIGPRYHFLGIS